MLKGHSVVCSTAQRHTRAHAGVQVAGKRGEVWAHLWLHIHALHSGLVQPNMYVVHGRFGDILPLWQLLDDLCHQGSKREHIARLSKRFAL